MYRYRSTDEGCATVLLGLLTVPILVIGGSVVNGWVLSILWQWFMVPVFRVPAITTVQAIGLAMVVAFLTYQQNGGSDKKQEDKSLIALIIEVVLTVIFRAVLTLLFGLVVHMFM